MKIFLSWSGNRSKAVALALREWLPLVLHYAEPWLSDRDIQAGERWSHEVGSELEASNFGVICLTKDNLEAPWILFEAGAISKAISASAVCPYLLDADFREISGPLSQFQAKKTDRRSTLELVQAVNARASEKVEDARLEELFDALWSRLEQKLQQVPDSQAESQLEVRPETEVLEELVETVRTLDRKFAGFELSLEALIRNPVIDASTFWRTPPADISSTSRTMWSKEEMENLLSSLRPTVRDVNYPPVYVLMDTDRSKYDRGTIVTITPRKPTTFLVDLTSAAELNINALHFTWGVKDAEGREFLTKEDLKDVDAYFGDSERMLRLTDYPAS